MRSLVSRPAVLLIAFNRPALTGQVLEAIRRSGTSRLYVAMDGARDGRAEEAERCAAVAALVDQVDWAAQVLVRRREHNLGCKRAVTDALDWFYDLEPEGIVLEDDCLPGPDFFTFCAEMLARYRDDDRVWLVSGDNLLGSWQTRRSDYFYGDGGIWGWASWRRAWQARDIEMATWDDPAAQSTAREFLGRVGWRSLAPRYAEVAAGRIDTWDYQWSWTRAKNRGLSVIPSRNLVSNIGFGADATHTLEGSRLAAMATGSLGAPLRPPATVRFDRGYQTLVYLRERTVPAARGLAGRALARRRPS